MSQTERDRLVCLKKASQKLITRTAAAAELKVSERQVYRLLTALLQFQDGLIKVMDLLRGFESPEKSA